MTVLNDQFLEALERRHLADLRFGDVTRALRALSSAYVERRETALAGGASLDGTGKRAAFALYYGPIHFLLVEQILRALGATTAPGTIVDLGCGTGVGGAAAASVTGAPHVLGIDTHPWALDEARFTYRSLGLRGETRRGHAAKTRFPPDTSLIVAAFVVNELNATDRHMLLGHIKGRRALIVEPISRRISPWWPEWEKAFVAAGGRSDEWKFRIDPPPIVKRLARAAGLHPEVLTARSVSL